MRWLFVFLLLAGQALAQSHQGYRHDNSVYCQNSPGMPARPGPYGYPGTGNQNPFGGECGRPPPQRAPTPPPPPQTTTISFDITAIGWISATPNPFETQPLGLGFANGFLAPQEVLAYQPQWILKTYLGLIATANAPPPRQLGPVRAFMARKDYRSLLAARVTVTQDARSGEPLRVSIGNAVTDGGWTPPFDRNRFPPTYLGALIGGPEFAPLNDPITYPGEVSMLSGIYAGRHPNGVLELPAGERLLANGLIRFRAGEHTDLVGLAIGSPYHVPWVWNEFALTWANGRFTLHGKAAAFPTTWWYVNGRMVQCQPRLADTTIPTAGFGFPLRVDTARLRVWPALSIGAPFQDANGGMRIQVRDENRPGPVDQKPHTVGAAVRPDGRTQWRLALGGGPGQMPDDPACTAR
ncbi:hypothetical protein [Siccirubricoccus phaeus]|uniref:hypothetical protein n=1 Tax=Siccirubricoccus phaeus TaxID=2595053 RepID=UPI0011F32D7A|nr:hypothetical protein [Siccirubricoccus phaeus]